MRNVFVVGGNDQVMKLFNHHKEYVVVDKLEDAEMVVFTGGADICPFIYGERPILGERASQIVNFSVERDLAELKLYREIDWCTPKVGICRGAQLLNVLAGGSLWQDVNNHTSEHEIRYLHDDKSVSVVRVSSTHHQMMIPSADANVLAVGTGATIRKRQNETKQTAPDAWIDSEIIYNWTNNSLCFQPHPEYGPADCTKLFFQAIEDCFFKKKEKAN